jgi:NAD(P)-dependent dehydrogenase (short-subunit alcohol dehydrogenase family)
VTGKSRGWAEQQEVQKIFDHEPARFFLGLARGRQIMTTVPQGRHGEPAEMVSASLWLVSDSASFVTGAVIPADGGFSACSGV